MEYTIIVSVLCGLIGGALWWFLVVHGPLSKPAPTVAVAVAVTEQPDLKLTLLGGNVFEPYAGMAGLVLTARVWNAGAPSIATDWVLTITIAGHPPITAQLTKPPDTLTLTGNPSVTLHAAEIALDNMAQSAALKRGDMALQSSLLFYARVPRADVMRVDTVLTLTVYDVDRRAVSVMQRIGDWLTSNDISSWKDNMSIGNAPRRVN